MHPHQRSRHDGAGGRDLHRDPVQPERAADQSQWPIVTPVISTSEIVAIASVVPVRLPRDEREEAEITAPNAIAGDERDDRAAALAQDDRRGVAADDPRRAVQSEKTPALSVSWRLAAAIM